MATSPSAPLRFLLIHQTTGHWAFPKGHPEKGESPLQSARRELFEETGIRKVQIVNDYSYTQHYLFEKQGVTVKKDVTFFIGLVEDKSVTVKEDEVQDFKWCNYTDALKRLTYEDSKELLRDVYEKLGILGLSRV